MKRNEVANLSFPVAHANEVLQFGFEDDTKLGEFGPLNETFLFHFQAFLADAFAEVMLWSKNKTDKIGRKWSETKKNGNGQNGQNGLNGQRTKTANTSKMTKMTKMAKTAKNGQKWLNCCNNNKRAEQG